MFRPSCARDRRPGAARPRGALGALAFLAACLAAGGTLSAATPATGPGVALEIEGVGVVGHLPMAPGDRLGVVFIHSVDGLPVQDWYALRRGVLTQESTRLMQYGAGMGHIAGEGVGRQVGDWWEVSGMNRRIGVLVLRIGSARVDHRLRRHSAELALSRCWPGRRLTVRPTRVAVGQRARSGCR